MTEHHPFSSLEEKPRRTARFTKRIGISRGTFTMLLLAIFTVMPMISGFLTDIRHHPAPVVSTHEQPSEASAQYDEALKYYSSGDYTRAAIAWRKSANAHYAPAYYGLGNLYANGQGVDKDQSQAVHYYTLAANRGFGDAQFVLGYCYENGLGLKQDYVESYFWLSLAGSQANDALIRVGEHLTDDQIATTKQRVKNWKPIR